MPRVNAMPYRSRPVPGSTVERRKALRARAAGRASDSRSGGRSPAAGPAAAPPSGPSSADRYGGDVLAAETWARRRADELIIQRAGRSV